MNIDLKELRKLLDYILENEKTHWEESDFPSDHVYQTAVRLSNKIYPN